MPIRKMSAAEVAADLGDRIARGEYGPAGSQMPRRRELAELYDVGMTTIAKVVLLLKERNLVEGVQGHAAYVAQGAVRQRHT